MRIERSARVVVVLGTFVTTGAQGRRTWIFARAVLLNQSVVSVADDERGGFLRIVTRAVESALRA